MNETKRPPLRTGAVLLAAGASRRMGDGPPKVLRELGGVPALRRAAERILKAPSVTELVVVVRPEDRADIEACLASLQRRVSVYVDGGEERTDSVRLGVAAISEDVDVVIVHDAARAFVRSGDVEAVAQASYEHGAALLAEPVRDTLKMSRNGFQSEETVDRSALWAAQTPQGMRIARFRDVLSRAHRDGFKPTDDAALHEHYHGPTKLVRATGPNPKLTTPDDLILGEALAMLETKEAERQGETA